LGASLAERRQRLSLILAENVKTACSALRWPEEALAGLVDRVRPEMKQPSLLNRTNYSLGTGVDEDGRVGADRPTVHLQLAGQYVESFVSMLAAPRELSACVQFSDDPPQRIGVGEEADTTCRPS